MRYFRQKWLSSAYLADRLIFVSLAVSLLLNIILWIILLNKFGVKSEVIPLHFSVVYGIDFVGPTYLVFELPILGLLVLIVNSLLAKQLYREQNLLAYFLTFGSSLVQILLLLAGLSVVYLVR